MRRRYGKRGRCRITQAGWRCRHESGHSWPHLFTGSRTRNPSRRAQRRRKPEIVDYGRWMSGSNPRRAKRRTPFLRNPSERAIMRKALKAAWRKVKRG